MSRGFKEENRVFILAEVEGASGRTQAQETTDHFVSRI